MTANKDRPATPTESNVVYILKPYPRWQVVWGKRVMGYQAWDKRVATSTGIYSESGIWVRESIRHDWRCISMPCNVSGAIQSVEFLTQD
jgi:hypothetical protein